MNLIRKILAILLWIPVVSVVAAMLSTGFHQDSVYMGFIALIFVGIGWWLWPKNRRSQAQEEALADQMQQEWETYCAKIVADGSIQPVAFPGIAKAGEFGLARAPAILYEIKAHRVGGGAGTRVTNQYVS